MRVLTLSTIYPNEKNDSIGRSVLFLDRALAKGGVGGITLFLRPWAPAFLARRVKRWNHLALRNRLEKGEGVTVIFDQYLHLPHRRRLDLSARFMAGRAGQIIRRYGFRFDLIHAQSIYPAGMAACLLSSRYRVPFILTLRDHLGHLEDMLARSGPAFARSTKNMFENVKGIFAHGPAILRDLPRHLPEGGSVRCLLAPNGVDVEGIERILASLPAERPDSGVGHIVSIGNLFRFKGIHENLRALKMLDERGFRNWLYTIVGRGPFREELERLSSELGLRERVRFTGGVPHGEAIDLIRRGDVFSLPSWEESFGNVYAEAAVCGRPAIGCLGLGAELSIRNGETGLLVPPRDVSALAGALHFLLTHPEEGRRMGEKARTHIRQFTWERTAQIYRDGIGRVLSTELAK